MVTSCSFCGKKGHTHFAHISEKGEKMKEPRTYPGSKIKKRSYFGL